MGQRSGLVALPEEEVKLAEMLQRCGWSGVPLLASLKSSCSLEGSGTEFWVDNLHRPKICAQVTTLAKQSSKDEPCKRVSWSYVAEEATVKDIQVFLDEGGAMDWNEWTVFPGFDLKWKDAVKTLAEAHGGQLSYFQTRVYSFYFLPLESAFLRRKPTDLLPFRYWLGPLCAEHAEQINRKWKVGAEGSLEYIRENIALRSGGEGACGVFYRKDGWSNLSAACGELVSWGLIEPSGTIGMLQTLEEHRRRGLARAVILYLSKWCAERKQVPFCYIDVDNVASLRIFERSGFQHAKDSQAVWAYYWPKGQDQSSTNKPNDRQLAVD